jgi:hypothetical protein
MPDLILLFYFAQVKWIIVTDVIGNPPENGPELLDIRVKSVRKCFCKLIRVIEIMAFIDEGDTVGFPEIDVPEI